MLHVGEAPARAEFGPARGRPRDAGCYMRARRLGEWEGVGKGQDHGTPLGKQSLARAAPPSLPLLPRARSRLC